MAAITTSPTAPTTTSYLNSSTPALTAPLQTPPTKVAPAVVTTAPAIKTVNNAQNLLTTQTQALQNQSQKNAQVKLANDQAAAQKAKDAQNAQLLSAAFNPDGSMKTGTAPAGVTTPTTSPTSINTATDILGNQYDRTSGKFLGTVQDPNLTIVGNQVYTKDANGNYVLKGTASDAQIQQSGITPSSTLPTSTGTGSGTGSGTGTGYNQQLADLNAQSDSAYQTFNDKLTQIQSGTFPLSPDQQAQVDSLQKQFDQLRQQQQLANSNYEGGVRQATISSGLERYSPVIAMGQFQAAVNSGIQKLSQIDAQAAKAISDLKQGFMDKDLTMIKTAYDAFTSLQKDKTATIQHLADQAQAHDQWLQDFNQKVTQDNFDNAMKSNQLSLDQKKEAFDEYIQKADLTEKQRMDAQTIWYQQQDLAIKKSSLALDQKKLDFEEGKGGMDGLVKSKGDIPGVISMNTLGVQYFDPSQFSDKTQAAAAERIARQNGVPILSDQADREAVKSISTAIQNINSLQNTFQQLAAKSEIGNIGDKITRPFSAAFDTNYGSLLSAYQQNRDILFQQISTLAGSHPRLNGQELVAAANALPVLGYFNSDTLKDGVNKLNLTRQYLNNSLNSVIPNRSFATLDDYKTANPINWLDNVNKVTEQLKAQNLPTTTDNVLQVINAQ